MDNNFGGDVNEARQTAYEWHGGQSSPLYAFASSGIIESKGSLLGEIEHCISVVSMSPDKYDADELDKLTNLQMVAEEAPEDVEEGSMHESAVSVPVVSKALVILQDEIIPELSQNPALANYMPKLEALRKKLGLALSYVTENEDQFSPEENLRYEPLVNAVLSLRQSLRDKKIPAKPEVDSLVADFQPVYTASIRHLQASLPAPDSFISLKEASMKQAMDQESFVGDTTKIMGAPGKDPDSTNFFDNRELMRKFYSQFYEGSVLIADDGTYYQVLELVAVSGNFVAMMQDVLHPQIVFTISVNDLVAHTWKWITPFDVVVNPELAPQQSTSIADLFSVGDLDKPEVPERWLSY